MPPTTKTTYVTRPAACDRICVPVTAHSDFLTSAGLIILTPRLIASLKIIGLLVFTQFNQDYSMIFINRHQAKPLIWSPVCCHVRANRHDPSSTPFTSRDPGLSSAEAPDLIWDILWSPTPPLSRVHTRPWKTEDKKNVMYFIFFPQLFCSQCCCCAFLV